MRIVLFALTLLALDSACYQTLNVVRLRPEECHDTCARWGMVLTGMVASPHDDACICEVPGRPPGVGDAGGAAAGIVVVGTAAREAEQASQPPVVITPAPH